MKFSEFSHRIHKFYPYNLKYNYWKPPKIKVKVFHSKLLIITTFDCINFKSWQQIWQKERQCKKWTCKKRLKKCDYETKTNDFFRREMSRRAEGIPADMLLFFFIKITINFNNNTKVTGINKYDINIFKVNI